VCITAGQTVKRKYVGSVYMMTKWRFHGLLACRSTVSLALSSKVSRRLRKRRPLPTSLSLRLLVLHMEPLQVPLHRLAVRTIDGTQSERIIATLALGMGLEHHPLDLVNVIENMLIMCRHNILWQNWV
jgi:hypothetical protein